MTVPVKFSATVLLPSRASTVTGKVCPDCTFARAVAIVEVIGR